MKLIPLFGTLALAAVITFNTTAIACGSHPADASATNIGSNSVGTPVSASVTDNAHGVVCVWSTSSSGNEAMLDVNSIYITGSGSNVDTVATGIVINRLRTSVVAMLISSSYLTCSSTHNTVRIYHAGSITRSGSGLSTTFGAASGSNTNWYDYDYYYAAPNSEPTITLVDSGVVPPGGLS